LDKRRKITFGHIAVIIVMIAAALFYPLAYLDFGIISLAYIIKVFTVPTLALLMLSMMLFQPKRFSLMFRDNPAPGVLIMIFTAINLLHFFIYPEYTFFDLCLALSWIIIPLFCYIHHEIVKRWMPYAMSLILLFTYIATAGGLLLDSDFFHYHYTGLPGNWNWNATLITTCTPFLVFLLYMRIKKIYGVRPAVIVSLFPVLFSLAIMTKCASKGQMLALLASIGVIVFCQVSFRIKKLLIGSGAVFGIIFLILLFTAGKSRFDNFVATDVRVPIWRGTINLIQDNLMYGTGMSRFESEYAPYQPLEYFLCKDAAERTNHPHNHFLYIAVCFGLPGFIAWFLLLVFPLVNLFTTFRNQPVMMKLYGFAFLVMLFHSMLDLVLYQWPTNILALSILGILWSISWPEAEIQSPSPKLKPYSVLTWLCGTCSILLLCVTGWMVFLDLLSSVYLHNSLLVGGSAKNAGIASYFHDQSLQYRKTPNSAYKAVLNSHFYMHSPELTLKYLKLFDDFPGKNHAHKNGFYAYALCRNKHYKAALPYLLNEAKLYPLSTQNWYKLSWLLMKLGRKREALAANQQMLATVKAKGFNANEHLRLMIENPDYDMHPKLLREYLEDRKNSQHD
jgi:O-antigen ligase